MNESKSYFEKAEKELTEKYGALAFFALFLREDAPDRWDLVVAAPWMDEDWVSGIKKVSREITRLFPPELMMRLSRISPVSTQNPGVETFVHQYPVQGGWQPIRNEVFSGLRIVEGFIVTAQDLPLLQPQAA